MSYEQIAYPKGKLGDSAQYLRDNMEVEALYLDALRPREVADRDASAPRRLGAAG